MMTHDSGLAPNPYFDVCSLALCTPNHRGAKLLRGDWIVGHSSKSTGHRLIYAMQLTKVLDMEEYFNSFPQKRPLPSGNLMQRSGDNLYYREDGRWLRLPSTEHNDEKAFRQDVGRPVYLAEGSDHFWYFGAANSMPEIQGFADRFPWLIQNRQGFKYVENSEKIQAFSEWLSSLGGSGQLGTPRDQAPIATDRFLIAIDPMPIWTKAESAEHQTLTSGTSCTRRTARQRPNKRGC
ncbi:hypothetical protein [Pseudomonas citronellolis]|uniref:Nmad2 family putative nucleotide modification protein n=1 Tax=Pseudomonas citronellolis TaxID=53408 RepID=UPI0023E39EB4|nr:hypothetical protein [Pseudomonas citronellolis]MDF3934658.1 hypothetical protein [Pseudomonas citronellolis]